VLLAAALSAQEFDVRANQVWTDTGISVQAGSRIAISATGSMQYEPGKPSGPEGQPRGWKDLLRVLPANDVGRGTLLARIGNDDAAQAFVIGPSREILAGRAGRLFLGINQMANESADGSYHVTVKVTRATATTYTADGTLSPVDGLTSRFINSLPRRVQDANGNPGDVVNFVLIGSEQRVLQALEAAGWVRVDRTKSEAVLHAILSSISKQAYTQLPMSELYLFGRAQDYGYAHAEPFAVAAQRHHFRIWKAPGDFRSQTVWAGAATHDTGFDKDQRNGKLTHKIDPQIDSERKYLEDSLTGTGLVSGLSYLKPTGAVEDARTATGEAFHSDGRVVVIALADNAKDRTLDFADVFCSVLEREHPDAGEWGPCGQYLDEAAGRTGRALPASTAWGKYRLLIVPGVFSACTSGTPAFREGQAHLKDVHGMTVELLSMPNDSTENNAGLIAQYLREHGRDDDRKYIVLGYSKGAPDVLTALVQDPEAARAVAAFVSVAGAVGGSPIADVLPAQVNQWMGLLKQGGACAGDLAATFRSLRRDVRQAFLTAHPDAVVPSYSIAAVSDRTSTSKMLLESWQLLSVFDKHEDSQLIQSDTILPGATFLGTAKADHFAVALPFEFSSDSKMSSMLDRNRYPRTTLLEALIRFITQ
jgi:hypothetical protein